MLSNFTPQRRAETNLLVSQAFNQPTPPGIDPLNTPQYWMGACGVILSIAVLLRILLPVMLQNKRR